MSTAARARALPFKVKWGQYCTRHWKIRQRRRLYFREKMCPVLVHSEVVYCSHILATGVCWGYELRAGLWPPERDRKAHSDNMFVFC